MKQTRVPLPVRTTQMIKKNFYLPSAGFARWRDHSLRNGCSVSAGESSAERPDRTDARTIFLQRSPDRFFGFKILPEVTLHSSSNVKAQGTRRASARRVPCRYLLGNSVYFVFRRSKSFRSSLFTGSVSAEYGIQMYEALDR
jgi:hypothetical protein